MSEQASGRIPLYAYYALAVLTAAGMLNFIDRVIVSILGQSIKTDLNITDAELGFLLGTAFAIFYAIIGISMGRIADAVSRTRLMAGGLAIWSLMTALGGAANSFAALSFSRIGVGIGETTANPCSHSLISQYFPARNRALALGVYLSSAYLGGAAAMILGGLFVQRWSHICTAVPIAGACGIAGWKAAFIAVGVPGLPLALLVASLRDPGQQPRPAQSLARLVCWEISASLPPFTFFAVFKAAGGKALVQNLLFAVGLTIVAAILSRLTGDLAQWSATAVGAYAIITWGKIQKHRDHPFYRLTFGCPTFMLAMLSAAVIASVNGAISTWAAPYVMRTLAVSPGQIGLSLGLTFASASAIGVLSGGFATDRWKRHDPRAPIWMGMISLLGCLPCLLLLLAARDISSVLAAYFAFSIFSSIWSGAFAALVQDLVLPRMRASAASAFALVSIVISASAGPYWVGKVSTLTGSLKIGMVSIEALVPLGLVLMVLTTRRLRHETLAGRVARAEAAGEANV